MKVEDQLRAYRETLDTATNDAAAHTDRSVAPVIRLRPVRTLAVAVVAVAAAIAIAFAFIGNSGKRSTPPAGVTTTPAPTTVASVTTVVVPSERGERAADALTKLRALGFHAVEVQRNCSNVDRVVSQDPAAGENAAHGATVTVTVCAHRSRLPFATLPVTVCPTEQGSIDPSDPHAPASITIATPTFTAPSLAAYSGKRGFLIVTAPAGWNCKAIEATDGGQGVGVTPPGATPRDSWGVGIQVTQPPTDGVFGSSDAGCQGCIYGEICGIVPTAAADFPGFGSTPCPRPPGETVIDRGNGIYEFDDPAGAIGPDAARSVLRYVRPTKDSDAALVSETCILPAAERSVCDELFAEFLARLPTPWTQTALTITPTSLGAVETGMTRFFAQEAAGLTFDGAGDGFSYPTKVPPGSLHLYVGFPVNGTKTSCVGAEIWDTTRPPIQRVTTRDGFALGGTVQQLLAIYGSRARYIPAPGPGSMTNNAGYVVQEDGGALAFAVHQNKVFEIAGGASSITPNSCTG